MGKLIHICLSLVLASPAFAQSASNFDTKPVSPAAPVPQAPPAAKPVSKDPVPASNTPSRNVSPEEMDAYLESVSSVFLSRTRTLDPFGQIQDPDAKPVIKTPLAKTPNRPTPIQVTPFSDIVEMIRINTIMPKEKQFLIGNRVVKQGDKVPLLFRNKSIHVEVLDVTSTRINFRNVDTGELAAHTLDVLPVGMTPGNRGITAPGMVPDEPNAPIDLDARASEP